MRSWFPAPRFWAVKLVMAVPRAFIGVAVRLNSLLAAPKPIWAEEDTMTPSSMSNCTTTLCMTMMPMASTENCSPRGTPCTTWRRISPRVICMSSRCSRSWGYLAKA